MDLCNRNDIQTLLLRHGFRFSKGMGQNFLIESWVPRDTADACGADEHTGVLEIGPGIGPLTAELCRRAGVKFTPAGSTWPYGRDPQDSNIRIAPSFASAEEIEPAARLFTICVRLATLEKLAATRFASETALGAERIA